VRTFLASLRELVLGETVIIPCGVAVLVGIALLVTDDAVGPLLALGAAVILVLAVARDRP
jgi:hypothetical protein